MASFLDQIRDLDRELNQQDTGGPTIDAAATIPASPPSDSQFLQQIRQDQPISPAAVDPQSVLPPASPPVDPNIPQLRASDPEPLPGLIEATGPFGSIDASVRRDIPTIGKQFKLAGQLLLGASNEDLKGTLQEIDPDGEVFKTPAGRDAFRFSETGRELEINPKGLDTAEFLSFIGQTGAFNLVSLADVKRMKRTKRK